MKRKREKCEDVELEEESNSKKRKIEERPSNDSKKANDFFKEALKLLDESIALESEDLEEESKKMDEKIYNLLTSCLNIQPNNSGALFFRSGFPNGNDLERQRDDIEKSLECFEKEFIIKRKNMKNINLCEELNRISGYAKLYSLLASSVKFSELSEENVLKEKERFLKYVTRVINLSKEYFVAILKENREVDDRESVERLREGIHNSLLCRGASYYVGGSLNLAFNDFVECKSYYESKESTNGDERMKLMGVYFHLGMIFFKFSINCPPTNITFMNVNLQSLTYELALEFLCLFIKFHEEGIKTPIYVVHSEIGLAYYCRGQIYLKYNKFVKAIKDFTESKKFVNQVEFFIQRNGCVEKLKSKIFQKSLMKF